jgi:hydrogenase expression/formation protein HypC
MCLGIPGQVVELLDGSDHLARADVSGVTRVVNVGLLEDEDVRPGDWVLIHVGFALSKIDEREAELALAALQLMGQAYDDEVAALVASRIAEELAAGAAQPGGQGGE